LLINDLRGFFVLSTFDLFIWLKGGVQLWGAIIIVENWSFIR